MRTALMVLAQARSPDDPRAERGEARETAANFRIRNPGSCARAGEFDVGTPVYGKALTAAELRQGLGLGS